MEVLSHWSWGIFWASFFAQRTGTRRRYQDDGISDDEIEGKRTFDLEEKLQCDRFSCELVKYMEGKGEEMTQAMQCYFSWTKMSKTWAHHLSGFVSCVRLHLRVHPEGRPPRAPGLREVRRPRNPVGDFSCSLVFSLPNSYNQRWCMILGVYSLFLFCFTECQIRISVWATWSCL